MFCVSQKEIAQGLLLRYFSKRLTNVYPDSSGECFVRFPSRSIVFEEGW